jgi:RNA polymerase sigma factor (sigma-70 family)
VSGDNKLAGIEREKSKVRLTACYEAYKRKEPGSADNLMLAVRALAYVKVYHLEHDFKDFGSAETADDWAQDVCVNVWSNLDKFKGTSAIFYAWVHSIAFRKSTKAFKRLKKENDTKVQLFTSKNEDECEDENDTEQDNPEIYEGRDGYGGSVQIPAGVDRVERNICLLIRDGRNYEEIAEELHMTLGAVTMRLLRLRERLQAQREQKKEKELPPEIRVPMRVTKPQVRAKDFAGKVA